MTLSPLRYNRLEYVLRNNGYHAPQDAGPDWVAADATFARGRCYLRYNPEREDRLIVATSLAHVGRAFADEGGRPAREIALPAGAVAAFQIDVAADHAAVHRLYELSRSLPTAPLDDFLEKTRKLPASTEAERFVIQRIGQDVFREALVDFWSGRCAVTALDQPELLRASHMKPWADCADDAERLDPHNGLLLAAHWDAAFDRGLVTFDEDGKALASEKLRAAARSLLCLDQADSRPHIVFRAEHQDYLAYHRQHVWLR